jgi:hypothetical protein
VDSIRGIKEVKNNGATISAQQQKNEQGKVNMEIPMPPIPEREEENEEGAPATENFHHP